MGVFSLRVDGAGSQAVASGGTSEADSQGQGPALSAGKGAPAPGVNFLTGACFVFTVDGSLGESTGTNIKENILTHVANTMWVHSLLAGLGFLITNQPMSLVTGDAMFLIRRPGELSGWDAHRQRLPPPVRPKVRPRPAVCPREQEPHPSRVIRGTG